MAGRMEERASFQDNPILWWELGVIGNADGENCGDPGRDIDEVADTTDKRKEQQ